MLLPFVVLVGTLFTIWDVYAIFLLLLFGSIIGLTAIATYEDSGQYKIIDKHWDELSERIIMELGRYQYFTYQTLQNWGDIHKASRSALIYALKKFAVEYPDMVEFGNLYEIDVHTQETKFVAFEVLCSLEKDEKYFIK